MIATLAEAVSTRTEWEWKLYRGPGETFCTAAYLAGQLQIAESIPDLKKLQDSDYIGSGSFRLRLSREKLHGEVDPHSYSTYTMRKVVQLSLRRLGQTLEHSPVHTFETQYEDFKRDTIYKPKPQATPRHTRSDAIGKGMKAEEVLDLIGAPDFVGHDTWEYDMDSEPPHSLIVKWDDRHVTGTEKRIPALWQEGEVRDRQVAERP